MGVIRPWTADEDLILRKLAAGGATDQAIAIELERSVDEVTSGGVATADRVRAAKAHAA